MSINKITIPIAGVLTALGLLGGIAFLPDFINTGIHPAAAQTTLKKFQEQLFAGVNLTPQQKTKIEKIRKSRNDRLKVNLTTPQFSNLRKSQESGKSLLEAIESLNPPLSKAQKARMKSIVINTSSQIRYVMTQKQQDIAKANLKSMKLNLPKDYLE